MATKGSIALTFALTPEIDCDQTAMGLPSVTAVLLIAKQFLKNAGV
jgi:hypothetical protein